jgi:hypothetical protein
MGAAGFQGAGDLSHGLWRIKQMLEHSSHHAGRHLLPAEFHANPIDPAGSLVTFDWGYDIRSMIDAAAPFATEIVSLDSLELGVQGALNEVIVSVKRSAAADAIFRRAVYGGDHGTDAGNPRDNGSRTIVPGRGTGGSTAVCISLPIQIKR